MGWSGGKEGLVSGWGARKRVMAGGTEGGGRGGRSREGGAGGGGWLGRMGVGVSVRL